jgi:hypothetical protein
MNPNRFPISFADGQVALGVRAAPGAELGAALRGMGLTTGVPTIVVVGAGSRASHVARLGPLLEKVVVRVAETLGATVVDEGTADGLPTLLGSVRRRKKAGFPLVGVAPDNGGDRGDGLDPEHTHYVLVPAREEAMASWISTVATALAGGNRSVALVAAGGEAAWAALAVHVAAGRLVMAVARSGGVADHLSAAVAGRPADERAGRLVRSGRICAVDPGRGAAHVAEQLRGALRRSQGSEEDGAVVGG